MRASCAIGVLYAVTTSFYLSQLDAWLAVPGLLVAYVLGVAAINAGNSGGKA